MINKTCLYGMGREMDLTNYKWLIDVAIFWKYINRLPFLEIDITYKPCEKHYLQKKWTIKHTIIWKNVKGHFKHTKVSEA